MDSIAEVRQTILRETMNDDGFMGLLRSNRVDERGFSELIEAVKRAEVLSKGERSIDRCIIAALFEAPWEIENCIEHYAKRSAELGRRVSQMADELREVINGFLWDGLDEFYR